MGAGKLLRVALPGGLRGWVTLLALAMALGAPLGAAVAVGWARSVVIARGGDAGDGIGFVIPALLGAVAAVLLVLLVAAVVAAARADQHRCTWVARRVVLLPVLAALPILALLFSGSLLTSALAVGPVAVTGAVAAAVWRSPRGGLVVLAASVVAGVTVVAVLGPQAVVLLQPHLLLSVGCWAIAAVVLAPAARDRSARPA